VLIIENNGAECSLSTCTIPNKEHYKILAMCWAGWLFDFYDLILFTYLIIFIGPDMGLSEVMLSYALGASLLATGIGGLIFGFLSDKYGRKKTLMWTILGYSAGTFLSALSPGFGFLVLARFVTGLGVGGEWATAQTYVSEVFHPDIRGRFGSLMVTGAAVGIVLASVTGTMVAPVIGWRYTLLLSVLPALITLYIRKNIRESDVWEGRKKDPVLSSVSGINAMWDLISVKFRMTFVKALFLAFLGVSAYWFTNSWMPEYFEIQRHLDGSTTAMVVTVIQIGFIAGLLTFGTVADKRGRRPAFTIYAFLQGIGVVFITLLWGIFSGSPLLMIIPLFITGFGTAIFGGFGIFFSELVPTYLRNTFVGAVLNIPRSLQVFTPTIIALTAQAYGYDVGMFLAAIFAFGICFFIWTFPETKGKKMLDDGVGGEDLR